MRLESQLSRMNCQTFSTGLSSGHFGGSRMMVILAGTRRRVDKCQPAWSTRRMAMGSGRDGCGDLGEVQVHRLGVAGRHDQGCTLALLRADCTEDVGGSGALVPRCAWTGAALGPAAGDLVLLADAGLVGEPDFYRVAVKRLLARNCLQARGEVFLKSSIAPSACAW